MRLGILGFPQVGKKTIFRLLTGTTAEKAPSKEGIAHAVAVVRDPRVDCLSRMFTPKRTRYAEFEIALPPDVAPSEARSARWLEAIRKVDGILHVIRAFSAPEVFHIAGSVDPARDAELLELELLLADLDLVEKRLQRIAKEHERGNVGQEQEKAVLEKCRTHLESEKPLRTLELPEEELRRVRGLNFLTLKPTVAVVNVDERHAGDAGLYDDLVRQLEAGGNTALLLSAEIEMEIAELAPEEQPAFLEGLGIPEPAAHRLSRAAHERLGLISFFTVSPDEVRAWTAPRGVSALAAAGKIHTDMERGFIRAEVIPFAELAAAGSEKAAREANLYRLKGKEYVVEDGEVIYIRFNV